MKVLTLLACLMITSLVGAQQRQTTLLINGTASFGSLPANRVARVTIRSNAYDEFELLGTGCQIVKVGDHWDLLPNSANASVAYIVVRAKINGAFSSIFQQTISLN